MESKFLEILNNIYTDKYMTAKVLADLLNISEKTIRNRIVELNSTLENYDCQILSTHGKGYKLEINNSDDYKKLLKPVEQSANYIPTTPAERVSYILQYLLDVDDYIKIDDICDFLYVSRNTAINDLKSVKYILKIHNLILESKPNYGIKIIGEEVNKRICLANNTTKFNSTIKKSPDYIKEMNIVAQAILEVFERHSIKISESPFDRLAVHIYTNTIRFKKNKFIHNIGNNEIIKKEVFDIAKEITDALEEPLKIKYDKDEISYLAIHLASKISSNNSLLKHSNFTISETIDELSNEMINHIYDVFDIDFRKNFDLKMNLNQHMVPFDIRMNFSIPLKNEMVETIKTEFSYAYTIATEACVVLNKYYGKQMVEDEIAFFALIFALALETREKEIQKKNIVLVYVSGKASAELFKFKYKKAFGSYINKIYECTVNQLSDFDFDGKEIDYVFTTVPINVELTVPIFEINLFPSGDEIMQYLDMFERGDLGFLKRYYKKELFISDINLDSKEDIIEYMCNEAKKHYDLPEHFQESVIKREKMGFTDFDDKIAMPHTNEIVSDDNFVVVFISSQPIFWGRYDVQVIFMIIMSEEKDESIDKFYELTTEFLFNKDRVNALIENSNYDQLIKLLSDG